MNNELSVRPVDQDGATLRQITKAIAFLALLTGLLYLRVIVGEFVSKVRLNEFPLEAMLLLVFLVVATAGLALSWRYEGIGGLLALLGGIGLAVIDYDAFERGGWLAAVLYSSPFIISGGLCLVCWRQRRQARA